LANGGTIFLDEIAEAPLEMQPKLLRVLDTNKVVRVGGTFERDLDVRVLSATNRNLIEEVSKGSFRQDLYFRLNVISLRIPPLRNRKDDILELAYYFLDVLNEENSGLNKKFSTSFEEILLEHEWKGNVRELKNIMQRAYYMTDKELIDYSPFNNIAEQKYREAALTNEVSAVTLEDIEKYSIEQAITANNGNVRKAADALNISMSTIYRKIKKYSINK